MLSSMMTSGLWGSAARNSSRFVTSISIHATRPLAACAAVSAAETPPASRIWFSLIRTASPRSLRWFLPPPTRTAYFSRARSPGVVFRVSRISALVPSTARTNRRVSVATPLSCCKRFKATRSPVNSARADALTRAGTLPAVSSSPSWEMISTVVVMSRRRKTSANNSIPARTSGDLAITSPRPRCNAETVVSVVISPAPISSARKDRSKLWHADASSKGDMGNGGRLTHLQHSENRFQGALAQTFLERDFRFPVAHAEIEFFHRVQLHVRTFAAGASAFAGSGNEGFLRASLYHLMQDAAFGRHDKFG